MELWDKMLNFDDNIGFTQWCYSENPGQKVQPKYGFGVGVNSPTITMSSGET